MKQPSSALCCGAGEEEEEEEGVRACGEGWGGNNLDMCAGGGSGPVVGKFKNKNKK